MSEINQGTVWPPPNPEPPGAIVWGEHRDNSANGRPVQHLVVEITPGQLVGPDSSNPNVTHVLQVERVHTDENGRWQFVVQDIDFGHWQIELKNKRSGITLETWIWHPESGASTNVSDLEPSSLYPQENLLLLTPTPEVMS